MKRAGAAAVLAVLGLAAGGARAAAGAAGITVAAARGASLETAALLLGEREGGTLSLAAAALPVGGEPSRVAVELELVGSAWLDDGAAAQRLDVAVYLLDAGGAVAGDAFETITVAGAAALAGVRHGGLRHVLLLPAAPGRYGVRLLVRDARRADRLAMRRLEVEVPSAGVHAVVPRFADGGAWVPAAPERDRDLPGGAFLPVRGIARIGGTLAIALAGAEGVADGVADGDAAGGWRVELTDAAGTARELPLEIGASGTASVALPAELAPGEARLALRQGERRSAAMSLVLVDADPEGRSWAELDASSSLASRPSPPAAPATARRLRSEETVALRAGLEEVRRALAVGEVERAALALRAATDAVLGSPQPLAPGPLAELVVERWLADGIAERPERLVPWLGAAVSLLDGPARGPRAPPSSLSFASRLVAALAERAARRGVPEDLRRVAARALLAAAPASADRRAVLRQALALAPTDADVLASAATDAMARGAFADAEPLLERWLTLDRASVEARVRLGELSAQTGRIERAGALWRSAMTDAAGGNAGEAWLGAVAAQEVSRRALIGGDVAAAERAARDGLARVPGDEKLRLLLAAALDARGRRDEATAALADLAPAVEGGPGPRLRFGLLAAERLAAARAAVLREAEARRGALAGLSFTGSGR